MATPRNPIEAFIWGEGGAALTPEEIARRREEEAAALAKGGIDMSPVYHPLQGVGRVAQAAMGAYRRNKLEGQQAENNSYNDTLIKAILGGGTGDASPSSPVSAIPPSEAAGQITATDPIGEVLAASGNAPSSEWLRYSNKGATRSQPLNEKLVSALGFLPDLGVQMEVFSGGQPGIGEGGARTGSTRHDHGNAADAFFYKDGRRLDWANEQDRPIFEDIVRRGKAAGITGFGAGDGYMQPGSMHIGFGNPSVWGAGGRGSNAPDWLRSAFDGEVGSAQSAAPVEVAQAAPSQAGVTQDALIRAITDPRANQQTRGIAQILLENQMRQQQATQERAAKMADPAYQLGLEKSRLEVENLRNPRLTPGDQLAREKFDWEKGNAGQTADIKEYEYAKDRGYEGSFVQFQLDQKKAGASSTTINNGEGDKFYENLDKKNAESFAALSEAGVGGRSRLGQLNQLEALLSQAKTGGGANLKLWLGDMGINTDGLNELQATRAFVEKLVPEQRAPGSGPMSDADIAMYRRSLPSVINQPGGNALILGTAKAIAQYDIQMGEIADQVADRTITPAEGRKRIRELENPLDGYSQMMRKLGGVSGEPSAKAVSEMSDDELRAIIDGR